MRKVIGNLPSFMIVHIFMVQMIVNVTTKWSIYENTWSFYKICKLFFIVVFRKQITIYVFFTF
jgi:hypothetical protein